MAISVLRIKDEEGNWQDVPAIRGKDGGYYTPKVTQPEENMLSLEFYPSDDSMGGALGFPVILPAGPAGNTPQKGVDYFTDTDKAELVDAVIAALSKYTGEVVA